MLISDRKPPTTILRPRMQVNYNIESPSTKDHCNEDGLSRLPLKDGNSSIRDHLM